MNAIKLKMLVAGATILAAVSALAVMGVREGWTYFLPVDQFLADEARHTQRVRLHGVVSAENLKVGAADVGASFTLTSNGATLPVRFVGVVPDMFQADREVVVEGRLDDAGVFQADVLMTKCASKYTSDGQAPHVDPHAAARNDQRNAQGGAS